MRRAGPSLSLGLTLFCAWPSVAAAEDLTVVCNVTNRRGLTRTAVQYVSATRVRTSDGLRDTILDVPTGRVTLVDTRRREYSETSLDQIREFTRQLDAAMEGNALMEKLMGKVAGISVLKGPEGRKVAGYDTDLYTLAIGDGVRLEVWTAPALEAPPAYHDACKVIYATMGPMGRRFERLFEELKTLKGFPLATATHYRTRAGMMERSMEAAEVRKGPIPESAFALPPGLRKVDSPFAPRM